MVDFPLWALIRTVFSSVSEPGTFDNMEHAIGACQEKLVTYYRPDGFQSCKPSGVARDEIATLPLNNEDVILRWNTCTRLDVRDPALFTRPAKLEKYTSMVSVS